ncbi:hypothetical protein GP475_08770 [Corynebacterium poyangense]|uniref:DUF3168 domain-containing protein n=1 Tax=Corynebacterium poyangense TaxID=2684405 RepID=A0A7H0SQ94_9CORY|nr:hypothetical protein [Corynebacterium poyangense]QNQ90719.1 hypothetical protein GP475_08770 [Corynebacterium poyangense]
MIQPEHKRFDPLLVLVEGLKGVGHEVCLARDATYDGDLVTVVQVPLWESVGGMPGQRWAYRIRVTLLTSGPDWDSVAAGHDEAHAAILALTGVNDVKVSSVVCESEPTLMAPHTPSGAESCMSSYTLFLRRVS